MRGGVGNNLNDTPEPALPPSPGPRRATERTSAVWRQLRLSAISFAGLLFAYAVYAGFAVPLIEPPAPAARSEAISEPRLVSASRERLHSELASLFPEDAWERERPKVVETDQGVLLFKDYRPMNDGRIELSPCTLVFFLPGAKGEPRTARRAMIMLVPKGAVLQFDGGADTTRGEFGRLVGGSLRGEVRIHAPESRPGANDQIDASTDGVKIDEQRIWTPQRVDFRFGPSYGSGSELTIGLAPRIRSKSGGNLTNAVGGIASLRIERLDRLHIEPPAPEQPSANNVDLSTRAMRSLFQGGTNAPLEVFCDGPLEFQLEDSEITFEDSVRVERIVTNSLRDELRCDRLSIFFRHRSGKNGSPTIAEEATPPAASRGPLELERIVARGAPATLQAPSVGAAAQAELLEYNLRTREFRLKDGRRAQLQHLQAQIETPELQYQLSEDPQRLGVAWAAGPGLFTTKLVDDPNRPVTIAWNRELKLRPQEDSHLLSLIEDVRLEGPTLGELHTDELHVWLIEMFDPSTATDPDRSDPERSELPVDVQVQIDRLLASGSVRIESLPFSAKTNRLEAWIRRLDPSPATAGFKTPWALTPQLAAPQTGNTASNRGSRGQRGNTAEENAVTHHVLNGDLLRLQLLQIGTNWALDDLMVEGHAYFAQSDADDPESKSLQITGDSIEALELVRGNGELNITGSPASVAAKNITTTAANIHMSQAENHLWIDGEGQMAFYPPPRAKPRGEILYENDDPSVIEQSIPPDMVLSWNRRLDFDGQRAQFSKDVQARGKIRQENREEFDWLAMGNVMEVALRRKLQFAAGSGQPTPEIDRVGFVGSVFIEGRTTLDQRQMSVEQFQLRNLTFSEFRERQPQRLHGDGPGWLSTVRYDEGSNSAEDDDGPLPNPGVISKSNNGSRLVYLRAEFARAIDGRGNLRQVDFTDRVTAIFGPVQNWNEELDPRAPQGLGPTGVQLKCQQLSLIDTGNQRNGNGLELIASGNAEVESRDYRARGQRVSYVRTKDLLVLEGDSRGQAEIWKKPLRSNTLPDAIARKILYRPHDQHIEVDGAQRFEWKNPQPPVQATNPQGRRKS